MKRNLQHRLVAIATLLLSMLLLPNVAMAQDAYAVLDGDVVTFYYDNQRADRTNTYNVPNGGSPLWNSKLVKKIVFDASFKDYRPTNTYSLFSQSTQLTTIEGLEYFNTSEVTNMAYMFFNCNSLTSLDLSSFDTAKVTNMNYMFYGCYSLSSLNLSSFNTANVTDMSDMFNGCNSLSSLDLASFDTSSAKDMHYMFCDCNSLSSLDLSNFDTANVTDMNSMFYLCEALTKLNLSSFDTSNVTDMNYMFSNCSSLTSLDISSFNTANVTNMKFMFTGSKSLKSLDLSNFDTAKVTNMKKMFSGCLSLTSLNIANFVTTNEADISNMFLSGGNLTTIYCNNTWSCSKSDGMFVGCSKLKGAVAFDSSKTDVSMANPDTGYFTRIETSVSQIECDNDASVEVYNLQGIKVADSIEDLGTGIYIVRQGKSTKKIAVQ